MPMFQIMSFWCDYYFGKEKTGSFYGTVDNASSTYFDWNWIGRNKVKWSKFEFEAKYDVELGTNLGAVWPWGAFM